MNLGDIVQQSAARSPSAIAVRTGDQATSYGELDALANRLARALQGLGVRRGDRVGICLPKSAVAVAAMQAALRLGAVYVPLDPLGPPARARVIAADCELRALVTVEDSARAIVAEKLVHLPCVCVDGGFQGPRWDDVSTLSDAPVPAPAVGGDALAYILYTSGSTGTPKGVCITHDNALAFIAWAARELAATPEDRFASHAPFHFDLSVLDLYVAFHAGASVVLVDDAAAFNARLLVDLVARAQVSVWYSVPSALILMMEQGGLLTRDDLVLRAILFAGEPFPVQPLRRLHARFAGRARLLNLYGPTETNVCTYHEILAEIPVDVSAIPIGRACSGARVWAVRDDGATAEVGEEGELRVEGPTVMRGYWGRPLHGAGPYATGDLVRNLGDGVYAYVGRRDHMVKVRGHRVELGEIEACLRDHPDVRDAAVVVHGAGVDARIVAFVVTRGGASLGLLALKRHCAERLPRSMIVDKLRHVDELPRTRNGKIDRAALAATLEPAAT